MSIQVVDQIIMKPVGEIRPYFRNPRKNDKTVALLVDLIPKVGFNVPILLDKDSVIVKGHARYYAAIRLGLEKVPCVITEADEESIKLDRLADNKVSEFTEWVDDELLHELDALNVDFDLAELGFPTTAIDDFLQEMEEEDDDEGMSDAERKAAFQKYLEENPTNSQQVATTQASIDRAVQKQQAVPEKPKRYFKMVCEECGHIMFVAEDEARFEDR